MIDALDRSRAETVSKHVISWDLKKGSGDLVEVTTDNVLRLNPGLFDRLFAKIVGYPEPANSEQIQAALIEDDSAVKN